jgi:exodeoxyribonuclease VIII
MKYPFVGKLSEADYDAVPALRSTLLKEFIKSPAHYRYAMSEEAREANAGKSYFLLGSLIHAAILEPDTVKDKFVVCNVGSRNAKEYKAAVDKEAGRRSVILTSEFETANKIVAAAQAHPQLTELLSKAKPEISAVAKLGDVMCKCRMDGWVEADGHIFDLKSTSEDAGSFPYNVCKYGYDVSAAFYVDILLEAGLNINKFSFVVLEKNAPYGIKFYEMSEEFIIYGRAKYEKALANYKQCLQSGNYPTYDSTPTLLFPPGGGAK